MELSRRETLRLIGCTGTAVGVGGVASTSGTASDTAGFGASITDDLLFYVRRDVETGTYSLVEQGGFYDSVSFGSLAPDERDAVRERLAADVADGRFERFRF